jgi:hypothetical protein
LPVVTHRNVRITRHGLVESLRSNSLAAPGEPHCGILGLDQRKETPFAPIEREAMVHDHEQERSIAVGPDHIGDRRQRDRDRTHFLLNRSASWPVLSEGRDNQYQNDDRVDDENAQEISAHGMRPVSCGGRLWLPQGVPHRGPGR